LSVLTGIGNTGLGNSFDTPLPEQLRQLRELESMGLLHIAGAAEAAENGAFASVALAAEHTKKALVGPTMTNSALRNPIITAGELKMIDWISGGRAFLGLGSGGGRATLSMAQLGHPSPRLADTREFGLAVKNLCRGEEVEYQGRTLSLWSSDPVDVRLALDATGPKTMELAGEIADVAVTAFGLSQEAVAEVHRRIAAGATKSDREASDIQTWFLPIFMLAPTEEEARQRTKFYFAARLRARARYPHLVPEELVPGIRALASEFRDEEHGQMDLPFNASLVDKYGLTDWTAQSHLLGGPPERIVDRIQEIHEYGVDNIIFVLWGSDEERMHDARVIADKILPQLAIHPPVG
jgi:5,10-methylenetetrahydromethanopterin reductase